MCSRHHQNVEWKYECEEDAITRTEKGRKTACYCEEIEKLSKHQKVPRLEIIQAKKKTRSYEKLKANETSSSRALRNFVKRE